MVELAQKESNLHRTTQTLGLSGAKLLFRPPLRPFIDLIDAFFMRSTQFIGRGGPALLKHPLLISALVALLLFTSIAPAAQAQAEGPLVMEAEFQWMLLGGIVGVGISSTLWLTDPGNPNIQLTNELLTGLSYGMLLGLVGGFFMLQGAVNQSNVPQIPFALKPENRLFMPPEYLAEQPGNPQVAIPVVDFRF